MQLSDSVIPSDTPPFNQQKKTMILLLDHDGHLFTAKTQDAIEKILKKTGEEFIARETLKALLKDHLKTYLPQIINRIPEGCLDIILYITSLRQDALYDHINATVYKQHRAGISVLLTMEIVKELLTELLHEKNKKNISVKFDRELMSDGVNFLHLTIQADFTKIKTDIKNSKPTYPIDLYLQMLNIYLEQSTRTELNDIQFDQSIFEDETKFQKLMDICRQPIPLKPGTNAYIIESYTTEMIDNKAVKLGTYCQGDLVGMICRYYNNSYKGLLFTYFFHHVLSKIEGCKYVFIGEDSQKDLQETSSILRKRPDMLPSGQILNFLYFANEEKFDQKKQSRFIPEFIDSSNLTTRKNQDKLLDIDPAERIAIDSMEQIVGTGRVIDDISDRLHAIFANDHIHYHSSWNIPIIKNGEINPLVEQHLFPLKQEANNNFPITGEEQPEPKKQNLTIN